LHPVVWREPATLIENFSIETGDGEKISPNMRPKDQDRERDHTGQRRRGSQDGAAISARKERDGYEQPELWLERHNSNQYACKSRVAREHNERPYQQSDHDRSGLAVIQNQQERWKAKARKQRQPIGQNAPQRREIGSQTNDEPAGEGDQIRQKRKRSDNQKQRRRVKKCVCSVILAVKERSFQHPEPMQAVDACALTVKRSPRSRPKSDEVTADRATSGIVPIVPGEDPHEHRDRRCD